MKVGMLGSPPVGTVTMLFTDVEGSTRLAQTLGAGWPAVLADHRALMRSAIATAGGHIERTEGDSFFVTFADADAAVRAAADCQRAMRAHPWPEAVGELRVRMGIHTGEIEHTDGHYVGLEVHRAARVGNAASGGQVLLTAATRDRLRQAAPCEDVGSHRLKDFPDGQRLFHLVVHTDRPASEFPPPRALDVRPTNLAPEDRVLIGRASELASVRAALLDDGERLVILSGLGGVGKTRIALAAGTMLLDEHPGGVWLVRAEALRTAEGLVPALAAAMRVRDLPGADLLSAVAERLDGPRTLVVFDNLEHLAGAPAIIAELMTRAPRLRVLGTSRAPLRLAAERPIAIRPLAQEDAVTLFATRARVADPSVVLDDAPAQAAIAEICERLEGLPLTLELAAARLRVLTPRQLADRLGSALDLHAVESDRPERQRSLRATVEWTLGLLPADAQRLFARLAVFAGSPPLEIVEAVCADGIDVVEAAAALVDFSLLRRAGSGLELVAALREVAAERLAASGEEPTLRRSHAETMARLAVSTAPFSDAPPEALALVHALQDDLWDAVVWAREDAPALHRQLATAIEELMATTGRLAAILAELDLALEDRTASPAERRRLLLDRSHALALAGRAEEGVAAAEEAASLLSGEGAAERADVLAMLMVVRDAAGDACGAVAAGEEALALRRTVGPPGRVLHALIQLAQAHLGRGDFERAETLIEEAEALAPQVESVIARYLPGFRGDLSLLTGDAERALASHARALEVDNPYWEWAVAGIVLALVELDEPAAALELGTALELDAAERGLGFEALTTVPGGLGSALARAGASLSPAEAAAAVAAGRALRPAERAARAVSVAARVQTRLAGVPA